MRRDEAILEYETVLASNPNALGALLGLANCKFFIGSIEDAVPLAEQITPSALTIRRSGFRICKSGERVCCKSRIDEAIVWLEKARNADPAHPTVRAFLACAFGLKGEIERAAAELAEARKPNSAYSSIASAKKGYMGLPNIRALSETTFFAGLRKAGVPEE